MSDVQVHRDSPQPSRFGAYALTDGRDIHLGPGREDSLPHEAWHVVQQRQGRVRPNRRSGNLRINANSGLEREAEVMGRRAMRDNAPLGDAASRPAASAGPVTSEPVLQMDGPTGTVETSEGVEEIEGTTITATGNFAADVVTSLNTTMNRAMILGNGYAIEVENACEDFESYAERKIAQLEGEITGAELASALVGGVLSIAAGPLVGRVAEGIGRQVVQMIVDTVNSKIKDSVKDAASNSSDASDLRQAISLITQGARDASSVMRQRIQDTLSPIISAIQVKANAGETLTPDEDAFSRTFYLSPSDQMTASLTAFLGIPSADQAIDTRIAIYQRLITDFEERYFNATTTLRQQIYWSTMATSRSGAREYAHTTATAAASRRREAIESSR